MADTHRHVNTFVGHIDHPIDQQGVDTHQRKTVQIIPQYRRHIQLAKQYRCGHRQLAARDGVAARRRFLGFVQLGKDASAIVQVTLAGFGQVQAAGGARQQLRADALFHGGNGAGHAGRRRVQAPGGSSEALLLGHGQEHLHFMKSIHLYAF